MQKSVIVAFLLLFMVVNQSIYATQVTDIENHWAQESIEDAIENGYIQGYADGTFRPNQEISLAEFIKILLKEEHHSLIIETDTIWPDAYLKTAQNYSYINEKEESNVMEAITRNEAVKILSRYLGNTKTKAKKISLKDVEKDNKENISKLISLEIIKGYEDDTFRGDQKVTRAEALVMIERAKSAKKKNMMNQKYELESCQKYTNYGKGENEYTVTNNKLIVNQKEITSAIWSSKKVMKLIKSLVNEEGYTMVQYIPSQNYISQLIVSYGENEKMLQQQMNYFSFTYFENEAYDLRKDTGIELFSSNCYMKIEIQKLWNETTQFQKGNYIEEYEKNRFQMALEEEFGKEITEDMMKYFLQKYTQRLENKESYQTEMEQKRFGKYRVNYYQEEGNLPAFYISLSNS